MNKNDFFVASKSKWYACNRTPERKPDFVSGEGESRSEYWFTPKGVYRCSNHWSRIFSAESVNPLIAIECKNIRFCWWVLDAHNVDLNFLGQAIGYSPWKNFQVNTKLYERYLRSSWYQEIKIKY